MSAPENGTTAPSQYSTINAGLVQTALLDDIVKRLANVEGMIRAQIPDGKPFPVTLNYTSGSQLTRIDYVLGEHNNLPPGTNITIPYKYLYSVTVINDGPADIKVGIVQNKNDKTANVDLKFSTDPPLSLNAGRATYRFINIYAAGNTTVRIIGMT